MSKRLNHDSTRRSVRSRARRKSKFRPALEGLETRLVLSTITWSGKGDGTTFSSGANWNGNVTPGSGDDAQIAISGFNAIQLPAGGITLHSLSVNANDTLNLSAGTLTTTTGLNLNGVTLNVSGGSVVGPASLGNSTLNFSGGSISATLSGSTLNYLKSIASTDSFLMLGSDTVSGPISASQTLTIQGNNTSNDANLTLAAGSTNLGTIVLQSATGSSYACTLTVASGTTFVNSGTVKAGVTANRNEIDGGSFDNQGTVSIAAGATLQVYGSTFTQDTAGTISAIGEVDFHTQLLVTGGVVSGNIVADGYLQLASTITSPTTIYASGATLLGNASPLATVWVVATNDNLGSTLTIAPGATNAGTILLEPALGFNYSDNLTVASGTTFVNTGKVESGFPANLNQITGGNFDNQGTVKIDAGAALQFDGSTFTQDTAGTISAIGEVDFYGQLLVTGGAVSGNVIAHGYLQLAATINSPTTIYSSGATLLGNASPLATVWVVATNDNLGTTLTIAPGATNAGTILLEPALGFNFADNLTVASGTTFVNTGKVESGFPANLNEITGGNFDNQGTVEVDAGAALKFNATGSTFTQETGGTLSAVGNAYFTQGTLLVDGGAVSGNVFANGCYLQLASTISSPTTIYVYGASRPSTLLGNASPQATVWVEASDDNFGSTLIIAPGATNVGTILLQSADGSSYPSNLTVTSGTTFVNTGTVVVAASSSLSSPSVLMGRISNAGTLVIAETTLELQGSGTSLVNQPDGLVDILGVIDGSLTNNGTLSIDTGEAAASAITGNYTQSSTGSLYVEIGGTTVGTTYDQLTVSGSASLAGTLTVAILNGFSASIGDAFNVLYFGSASGSFSSFTGVDLANGLVLVPAQTSTGLTLTATTPTMFVNATAGSPQSTVVGTAFATAFQATVDDKNGNPISGIVVTFAAPSSGVGGTFTGHLTSVTATTNALGVATAPAFTAGTVVGSYTVTATASGPTISASYSLTNTVGAAASVSTTAGTPQSGVVGVAFATLLQATVDDQYGNPISGAIVTFAAPSSGVGGTFAGNQATVRATTNALGVATAPAFTAGTIAGAYVVTASVPGVSSSASFSLTNTAGAVSSVVASAGTPQNAVVGTAFATALQVTVDDQYGNPVSGVTVTFAAPTTGAGGGFAGARTVTATTNALGVAIAPALTANISAGGYNVTASVSGTASVASFSLTNSPGLASRIIITSGTPQTVVVNTAFATALQVAVDDKYGNPISGVVVTFVAPTSGAGGSFSAGKTVTSTTNALGLATAPAFVANTSAGHYSVIATVSGLSSSASFSLTNTAKTSTTLTIAHALVPLGQPVTFTATLGVVAPGVSKPGGSVSFYDGSKLLQSVTINSSGQAVYTTSTLGYGVHSITATYTGDPNDLTSTSTAASIRIGNTVADDFDGTGKSEIAIYDQSSATFYIQHPTGQVRIQPFGNPADKNVPIDGDYDGDSKTDIAIYDQSLAEFFILDSNGGSLALPFGNAKHVNIPVAGDFDGSGKTNIAIYDQTASIFYILYSNGGSLVQSFGNAKHVNIPVAGDFDGDGKTDIAIYDQTAATFYIVETGGGTVVQSLGNSNHINVPIASNFNGNGKTDLTVYDQTAGILYSLESGGGTIAQAFGNPAALNIPLMGDYDGDGKTDIGIFDATDSVFLVIESGGGIINMAYGNSKHTNRPV